MKKSIFPRSLRFKEYELKDHLGNVRVVIDDVKCRNSFSLFDFKANPIAVNISTTLNVRFNPKMPAA
jgi:hypothetical protein